MDGNVAVIREANWLTIAEDANQDKEMGRDYTGAFHTPCCGVSLHPCWDKECVKAEKLRQECDIDALDLSVLMFSHITLILPANQCSL